MSLSVCGSGTKIGRLWMRVLEAAGRSNDSWACVCGIEILWRKRWWVLCCRAWRRRRRRRRWTGLFGTGSIICFAFTTFGLAVQNCRRLSLTSPISLQPPASSSMHNITWRGWTNPGIDNALPCKFASFLVCSRVFREKRQLYLWVFLRF